MNREKERGRERTEKTRDEDMQPYEEFCIKYIVLTVGNLFQ